MTKRVYKGRIKPCPKCKGRGRLDFDVWTKSPHTLYKSYKSYKSNLKMFYFVVCMECGYKGENADDKYQAIREWNDTLENQNLVARKLEVLYGYTI